MIKSKSITKVLPSYNAGSNSSAKKKSQSIPASVVSKLPKYNFGTSMANIGVGFGVKQGTEWEDFTGGQKAGTVGAAAGSAVGAGLSMAGGLVSAYDKNPDRFDKSDATSSMFSGVGSGVSSGIAAGAMFGPLGAAIGGVAGGVIGAIGAGKRNRVARAAQAKSDRIDSINLAAEGAANIGMNSMDNRKSKNLGIPGFNKGVYKFYSNKDNTPNARVASGETVVDPDGNADVIPGKYKGYDDKLGSIQNGSTILPKDKYFTLPDGKSTPADIGKKVSKIQAKAKEVLGRKNTSSINKRTHELNLKNADEVLDSVSLYAESLRNMQNPNQGASELPGYKGGTMNFNVDKKGNPVYSVGVVSKSSATKSGDRKIDEQGTDYAKMAFEGKDKGHLLPYFLFDEDRDTGRETFSGSNLIPQNSKLNRDGVWRKTEDDIKNAALKSKDGVKYAAGVIPTSREKAGDYRTSSGRIVPDSIYQSYVNTPGDTISYAMANTDRTTRDKVSYAEIKKRTGHDPLNSQPSKASVKSKSNLSTVDIVDRFPSTKSSLMQPDMRGLNIGPVKHNYAQNDQLKKHVASSLDKESKGFKERSRSDWKKEFNIGDDNGDGLFSGFVDNFSANGMLKTAAMSAAIGSSLSQYNDAIPETVSPETYAANKYKYRSNLFNQLRDIQAKENIAKYNNRVIGSNAGSASAMNSALGRNTNNAYAAAYDSDNRNRMQVGDLNARELNRVQGLNTQEKIRVKGINMRNAAAARNIKYAAIQDIAKTILPRQYSQYERG